MQLKCAGWLQVLTIDWSSHSEQCQELPTFLTVCMILTWLFSSLITEFRAVAPPVLPLRPLGFIWRRSHYNQMLSLLITHTLEAWTAFGSICVIVKFVLNGVIEWSATVLHISFLIFHVALVLAGIIKATIFSTFILAFLHWLITNTRFPAAVPAFSCSDSLAATVLTIWSALVTFTPFFPCWKQHKT